jgi:hypothetical protein
MKAKKMFGALFRKAGNRLIGFANRLSPPPAGNRFLDFFYPGHFYSPVPDAEFVDKNADILFRDEVADLPGIENNWSAQAELVGAFSKYAPDYKPAATAEEARATKACYFSENPFFKEMDAYAYYGMLRHYQPKKIVEAGSGFTSALAIDVGERFLNTKPRFVFIDPFPERLHSVLERGEHENVSILEKPVQQVGRDIFLQLAAGDFLFIDSSHVSKIGSDVNFLLLEILPRLQKGVIVHVHDVFWPFEYPKPWLDEGRSWNEIYLLRGILANSSRYRILFFNSYIAKQHPDALKNLPAWAMPGQAASIWFEIIS